jgi:hypothetical protein
MNNAKEAELKASGEALTACVKRALTAGHSADTIKEVVDAALVVDEAVESMDGGRRRRRRHTKKSKKSQRKSKK